MRKENFYFFFIALIFLFSLNVQASEKEDSLFSNIKMIPIQGNKKAPDFSLQDLDGKKIELKQFKGKVILLNFWATWCHPCREEMTSLEALHQQFQGKKFVLLTISVDYEGAKTVQAFVKKHHYTFPVLLDPKGKTLDLFGVRGIPATYLISKKGIMVGRAVGPRDWNCPEVIDLINLMLTR